MSKTKSTDIPAYKNIPVVDLIPYARNCRTHSEAQVQQIAASIKEFGFINPIVIDSDNGIIAGHGRLLAAHKLGLKSVPCLAVGHLTKTQKQAYIIADNKLAINSGWDNDLLRVELEELKDDGFNIDIIGFDENELKNIFLRDFSSDVDSVCEEQPPDFWIAVSFENEDQQRIIYDELCGRGLQCKIMS